MDSADVEHATATPHPVPDIPYDEARVSRRTSGARCFYRRHGAERWRSRRTRTSPNSRSTREPARARWDVVDCDPDIPQGQELEDAVQYGCKPFLRLERLRHDPALPGQHGAIFNLPNPGPPWNDWPPIECVVRRPTGSMNQLGQGLNQRLFGDKNSPRARRTPASDANAPEPASSTAETTGTTRTTTSDNITFAHTGQLAADADNSTQTQKRTRGS